MKINRKIRLWIAWSLFFFAVCFVLGYTSLRQGQTKIEQMRININAEHEHRKLIDVTEVKKIISKKLGYNVVSLDLQSVDLKSIESALDSDDRVENAELYIDKNSALNIDITQKKPIVRVMASKGSYYLDTNGDKIKHYKAQTIRVPIATGYISEYSPENVKKESTLKKVLDIAKIISKDEFYSALIEQIDVSNDKKIILIPKVGKHKLSLQEGYDLEEQFARLKTLYKSGLPHIGWKRHSEYRLDLDGQITGTKRK